MTRDNSLLLAAAGAGAILAAAAFLRRPRYDLQGRVVLVTGGSRGLGLILARQAVDQGARVAVCARDPSELRRAAHDLARRGATAYAIACDVRDRDDVE